MSASTIRFAVSKIDGAWYVLVYDGQTLISTSDPFTTAARARSFLRMTLDLSLRRPALSDGLALLERTYINWGDPFGDAGYGLRDNDGTVERKHRGGSWDALGAGGGGTVGPGTPNTIAKFSGDGSTVADATGMTDDGTGKLTVSRLHVENDAVMEFMSSDGGAINSDGAGRLVVRSLTVSDQAPPVDAVSASATVAASGIPADGNIVTVNGQPYTFKTALTPADYEVLINGQDGSLTNLEHAINGTGGTPGTDYQVPAAHSDVTAADVAGSSITLTAIIKGTAGNSFTLTKTGANLSVSDFATEATGADGTPGAKGEARSAGGRWYLCTADADLTTAGAWKIQVLGDL